MGTAGFIQPSPKNKPFTNDMKKFPYAVVIVSVFPSMVPSSVRKVPS